jgi:hypothetical protein
MSLFREIQLPCPACRKPVAFEAVTSVNADRRPDLRDEILNNTFQRETCGSCQAPFRLDPAFTYVDTKRGQWIQAQAHGDIGGWETIETAARDSFRRSYGPSAPGLARKIGAGLKPRVVFGWPALREKILAREAGIDDLTLELAKLTTLRGAGLQLDRNADLRLAEVRGKNLEFAWLDAESAKLRLGFSLPLATLDAIQGDAKGWADIRAEFKDALFVDIQRLMLPVA